MQINFFYEIVQILRTVEKRRTICLNIAQSLKRTLKILEYIRFLRLTFHISNAEQKNSH